MIVLKREGVRLTVVPVHGDEEIGRGLLRKIAYDVGYASMGLFMKTIIETRTGYRNLSVNLDNIGVMVLLNALPLMIMAVCLNLDGVAYAIFKEG